MASIAAPSGELALRWLSRTSALRMTSTGTPCCRAIDATTAESLVATSMPLPGAAVAEEDLGQPVGASEVRDGRAVAVRAALKREGRLARRLGVARGRSFRGLPQRRLGFCLDMIAPLPVGLLLE
jgi:hypothetical protein